MTKSDKIEKIKESDILTSEMKGSEGISYKTIGSILQALSVQLDEGETIYSETGKMSWMTPNIKFETKSRGFAKMISRVFTGETLFVNNFTSKSGVGVVTFSTGEAGKIIPVELKEGESDIIFQRGSFLCAENTVELSVALVKRLSAGLFGGKGLILQKVSGKGYAHLMADGEVVMYELKEGDELLVDDGNLVGYESTVDFDIQTIGGGVMNWFFGGEGIFVGVLRGPGKVWLQTRKTSLSAGSYSANNTYYSRNNGGFSQNPLGCIIGVIISIGFFLFFIFLALIGTLS